MRIAPSGAEEDEFAASGAGEASGAGNGSGACATFGKGGGGNGETNDKTSPSLPRAVSENPRKRRKNNKDTGLRLRDRAMCEEYGPHSLNFILIRQYDK
jgi:hypothetical protein